MSAGSDDGHRAAGFESSAADCRDGPQPVTRPSLEEAFTMPRDAYGDRLPERFLDVGAAMLRVTRCFQFSQVVLLQSCRIKPRCYDPHPQPQQPRSGCSAPARPAEYAIRTSRRFGIVIRVIEDQITTLRPYNARYTGDHRSIFRKYIGG